MSEEASSPIGSSEVSARASSAPPSPLELCGLAEFSVNVSGSCPARAQGVDGRRCRPVRGLLNV